jgi:hypothetical protein
MATNKRNLTHRLVARVAAVVTMLFASAGPAKDEQRDLGPGCAPNHPAVAHYAGGVLAKGQHEAPPTPCMTATESGLTRVV